METPGLDNDLWRINFPFPISGVVAFDSRHAAAHFPEKAAVGCIDLKHLQSSGGKARLVAVIPTHQTRPTLSVRNTLVAIGGDKEGLEVFDFAASEQVRRVEAIGFDQVACIPRSRSITALDWASDGKVLACGARSGSVHFIDFRAPSPVLNRSMSQVPLSVSFLKWNRLIETSLCSTQGDSVAIWDCRSLRTPVSQLTTAGWKSNVTSVDWIGPSDLIITTSKEGLIRLSDLSTEYISSANIAPNSPVCSIPTDTGLGLVAFQSATSGMVELYDPFASIAIDSFLNFDIASVQSIGYLEDSRSIVIADSQSLAIRSVARHGSGWSSKDASLMQSESSPRLHPVASHITASDQFISDEMKAVHAEFVLLARRIRRLYLEADVESDFETAILDIAIPDVGDRFKLKILLRAEDMNGGLSLAPECWWARRDDDSDNAGITLPDIQEVEAQLGCNLEIGTIIDTVRILKRFVADVGKKSSEEEDVPAIEEGAIPFPATCGICWSPQGDLYRFQSLKGMEPFPENRGKFSMNIFNKFNEIISSSQASTSLHSSMNANSSSVIVHLNEISVFHEPPDRGADDDALDEEFNQRVFTDACIQKLPAAVFDSIEDHWFAQMAPLVDFALSPDICLRRLVDYSRPLLHRDQRLVHETFLLLIELLKVSSCGSAGLDVVKQALVIDRLTELYKREQTQAVAIMAALLITRNEFFRSLNPLIFDSSLLLIHDHAVLFQRLGCFASSRFLEKIQARFTPDLPVIGEDSRIASVDPKPSCSVCGLTVHGLGRFCTLCGHGGHLKHISIESRMCSVAGCRCECWKQALQQGVATARAPTPTVSTFITS